MLFFQFLFDNMTILITYKFVFFLLTILVYFLLNYIVLLDKKINDLQKQINTLMLTCDDLKEKQTKMQNMLNIINTTTTTTEIINYINKELNDNKYDINNKINKLDRKIYNFDDKINDKINSKLISFSNEVNDKINKVMKN
jgi:hypothetical protein